MKKKIGSEKIVSVIGMKTTGKISTKIVSDAQDNYNKRLKIKKLSRNKTLSKLIKFYPGAFSTYSSIRG
jgi:hypothetical protein